MLSIWARSSETTALSAHDRSFRPDWNLRSTRLRWLRRGTGIPTSRVSVVAGIATQRHRGFSPTAHPSGPSGKSRRAWHGFISCSGDVVPSRAPVEPARGTTLQAIEIFRRDLALAQPLEQVVADR